VKQVVQNYRSCKTKLADASILSGSSNAVVVRNVSLIGIGTERLIIDLCKKGVLGKGSELYEAH
jgi:hypothetical protein